jgi:hypothetical protein
MPNTTRWYDIAGNFSPHFTRICFLRLYDTMLNFVQNWLENERGPMNDQDLTKTDCDPDRSLVLIEGLSHFLTNFLQNLASCQTSFRQFVVETNIRIMRSKISGNFTRTKFPETINTLGVL